MTLFSIPEPASEPPVPMVKMTEKDMLRLLVKRFTKVSMNAHRYAYADHVPLMPWGAPVIADFIAQDCYGGVLSWRPGKQQPHPVHGVEVKVSRSDWLAELRNPAKADAWRVFCNHWWLAVPDGRIVRDDLPDGWGLLVVHGDGLRAVKRAPYQDRKQWEQPQIAAFARAVAKTARREVAS